MRIGQNLADGPLASVATPLGNMFLNVPNEEAQAALDTAWREALRTSIVCRSTRRDGPL